MNQHALPKSLVKAILEHATAFEWELKGLGMMRTYLSDESKLHVWDERYRVPNVSMIHEHPWSFASLVIAGEIQQFRFIREEDDVLRPELTRKPFEASVVQCGPGGELISPVESVALRVLTKECYHEGQYYSQHYEEIHQSLPKDGTVTLVTRTDYREPRAARVYWPAGEKWVSSEPRQATEEEIVAISNRALELWF